MPDTSKLSHTGCRGRSDGPGGRGGRGPRRPDPTPCPLGVDEEGRLKIKITCMIMRDFAGAVIGRGGEHVTDIRKESGALVHVCKPDFETGKIQNTPYSQASP